MPRLNSYAPTCVGGWFLPHLQNTGFFEKGSKVTSKSAEGVLKKPLADMTPGTRIHMTLLKQNRARIVSAPEEEVCAFELEYLYEPAPWHQSTLPIPGMSVKTVKLSINIK